MKFRVSISSTYRHDYEVEADFQDEAEELAMAIYERHTDDTKPIETELIDYIVVDSGPIEE